MLIVKVLFKSWPTRGATAIVATVLEEWPPLSAKIQIYAVSWKDVMLLTLTLTDKNIVLKTFQLTIKRASNVKILERKNKKDLSKSYNDEC